MNTLFAQAARPIAAVGAVAALVGIALAIVVESTAASSPDSMSSPMTIASMAASLIGLVALVVALAGFAAGVNGPREGLGVSAFIVALVGATLTAGAAWTSLVIAPWFATLPETTSPPEALMVASPISYAILGLGSVLLGIAVRREGTAPGWVAALLIIGGILCVPPFLPARYTLVVVAVAALHLSRSALAGRVRAPSPA